MKSELRLSVQKQLPSKGHKNTGNILEINHTIKTMYSLNQQKLCSIVYNPFENVSITSVMYDIYVIYEYSFKKMFFFFIQKLKKINVIP